MGYGWVSVLPYGKIRILRATAAAALLLLQPTSRVRGAASYSMDGAGARRHARVTASAAAAGVKRSRDTAFIDADALPLSEQFASSYTVCSVPTEQSKPGPPEVKVEVWV